jgi:hypothetical protein
MTVMVLMDAMLFNRLEMTSRAPVDLQKNLVQVAANRDLQSQLMYQLL